MEIIARGRGGGYGAAAAQGRPEAVQVADRWHLMENASTAFLLAVRRRSATCGASSGIRGRDVAGLDAWIEVARASPVDRFAKGIAADRAAVAAAIETPWLNGQTEGQICRLKSLKRQMGGRANVDLLRERILPAA